MTRLTTTFTDAEGNRELRLRLAGCLDAQGVAALRPEIEQAATADAERVVVDLSDVAALDGSGVGAIGHVFKRAQASGRDFAVVGAAGQPLALLTDLGLAGLFGLKPRTARGWMPTLRGLGFPAPARV